jgi:hypothetical protein
MIRLVLCLVLTFSSLQGTEIKNLERKNLVPWCIVPFDAKKRTPEERAKMLVRLGFKRSAYDWRAQHVRSSKRKFFNVKNMELNSSHSGMFTKKLSNFFRNTRSIPKFGKRCATRSQVLRNKRSDQPSRP